MFKEFASTAKDSIEAIRNEDATLQEEADNIRNRLNEISKLRSKLIVSESAYESYIGAETRDGCACPSCFFVGVESSKMLPIASDNNNDLFKCSHSGLQIEVEP